MGDSAIVLKYLLDGNRPYSAVNLADAFVSQGITKTKLQRILDALVAEQKLTLVVCEHIIMDG